MFEKPGVLGFVPLLAISYRRQDTEAITGRIFDRLTLAYGKGAVFRDIDNIPAGIDFREHISDILRKSDLLIVVIGRRWLGRSRGSSSGRIDDEVDLVRIEVETALEQNLPIIPVLVGNAQMPPARDLPDSIKPLAFRNAIRVDAGQDFDNHISRLLRSVDGSISPKEEDSSTLRPTGLPSRQPAAKPVHRYLSSPITVATALAGAIVILSGIAIATYLHQQNAQPVDRKIDVPAVQSSASFPAPPDELEPLLVGTQLEALVEYLQKHPAEPRRTEILDRISFLKRAEFTEWTGFEFLVQTNALVFMKISSIQTGDAKFSFLGKGPLDRSKPAYIKEIPEGAYQESLDVYDCEKDRYWVA